MTIDEAIEHAKEVARTCDDGQCAADHIQLAEWLRRARGADKAARWYTEEIQELKAENTKLRYKVHVLEGGNKWLQILNDSLKANNARLRELVRDMMEFFEDGDWCVKCERALDCQEQEQYEDECLMRFVFHDRMRELGIEADS